MGIQRDYLVYGWHLESKEDLLEYCKEHAIHTVGVAYDDVDWALNVKEMLESHNISFFGWYRTMIDRVIDLKAIEHGASAGVLDGFYINPNITGHGFSLDYDTVRPLMDIANPNEIPVFIETSDLNAQHVLNSQSFSIDSITVMYPDTPIIIGNFGISGSESDDEIERDSYWNGDDIVAQEGERMRRLSPKERFFQFLDLVGENVWVDIGYLYDDTKVKLLEAVFYPGAALEEHQRRASTRLISCSRFPTWYASHGVLKNSSIKKEFVDNILSNELPRPKFAGANK